MKALEVICSNKNRRLFPLFLTIAIAAPALAGVPHWVRNCAHG